MSMKLRQLERVDYTEPKDTDDVTPRRDVIPRTRPPKKTPDDTPEGATPKDTPEGATPKDTPKGATPKEMIPIFNDITPLEIDIMVAIEDIDDLIDENPTFDDITTAKLEDHRTNLRRLRNNLMKISPQSDLLSEIKVTLDVKIKSYIKSNKGVNSTTKILQDKVKQDEIKRKQRSTEFLVNNITRDLKELKEEFSKQTDTATDEDISKWKKEIPHLSSKVDKVADNIKNLMQTRSSDTSYEVTLKNINDQFEMLFKLKKSFITDIDEELATREIEKNRDFNRSRLNIKLEKFSGYDSKIDFFTFRSNFEKVHQKSIPRQLLPELLKNNFLADHALNLVRNLDDIDVIWERLKDVYGNPKMMLSKRLLQLSTLDVSRSTKPEKAIDSLTKVINVLQDLMRLAQEHSIEEYLYYGDGLNTVYQLIGDVQTTKFLDTICNEDLSQQEMWSKLVSFLDHQKRIHQQRLMIQGPTSDPQKKDSHQYRRGQSSHHTGTPPTRRPPDQLNCFICQATNHVATNGPQGSKIVQYFACPKFAKMSPIQRFNELKSKGLCYQCLYPGAKYDQGKHKEGRCQKIFCCNHNLHDNYTHKKHVLVCDDHKSNQENKDLFEHYKSRCISKIQQLEAFSKDMRLTYLSSNDELKTESTDGDQAIYVLQTIEVDRKQYTLFYDNGCKNAVIKFDATKRLGSNRAKQIISRPIPVGGVGGVTTQSTHGIYTFSLPLATNSDAEMTGVCLDTLTATFPLYPLQGQVEDDIQHHWREAGNNIKQLPRLPSMVGGDIDVMIGIRYLRYFPKFVHELPSGLTIYQSQFKNVDGTYGVIGGPHEVFTRIENQHHSASSQFIANQLQAAKFGFYVDPDIRLLGPASHDEIRHDLYFIDHQCNQSNDEEQSVTSYMVKLHEQFETVGSNINYRCVSCRNCKTCKNHSTEDVMSIQEEVEQDVINRSISIDTSKYTSTASLPLIHDPLIKLAPNRDIALRVYIQQLKRLEKYPDDKNDIIVSEKKLQHLGFVEYVKNLPKAIQEQLSSSPINNFIPWRAVWKGSSVSTPCRVVFDASMPTSSGFSLNDILAKGRNSMNKLLEIFLRWRGHRIAFHTDIQKMYNSVKLRETDWCLQRYLWQESLDPHQPPEEKVIMTLIYGVKSSGNQAETALRETVKIYRQQQPEVARVIIEDVYVDDCLSGGDEIKTIQTLCNSIDQTLSYGGFTLKGITISGDDPKESLTSDGTTISVAGMKWHPKDDLISFDVNLDFAKKYRGKRIGECKEVPNKLTKRICQSKSAEIFDMTGMLTPITATFKLDIHDLVQRKLSWDDELPANLRDLWVNHFNLMEEIKTITYQRAIIPPEATSLKIDTLDFADASPSMICSAIYVRFPIPDGFSCQLIFSRSKLLEDTTQPRGELAAAVLNAHTGEIVRKAFKQDHTAHKFTDNQIALHWICNERRPLKEWVRNRVVEILRFTKKNSWKYIKSTDMIADLGTRRNTSLDLIKPDSPWFKGYPWMWKHSSTFPTRSPEDISLDQSQLQQASKEVRAVQVHHSSSTQDQLQRRYVFSSYLIDPNKHRFSTVVRIMALVFKFINIVFSSEWKRSISSRTRSKCINTSPKVLVISDSLLQRAEQYFYRKGTSEVKEFVSTSKYSNTSIEKDGILTYTGRMLPTDSVTIIGKATQRMLDLRSTSFCVPILEKSSPIAYSIVNDIHWNHPTASHSGVETTWRYVLQKVFIIEGRSLVKSIRSTCERCRYLLKKTVDVSMGPVSPDNLMIAPIFFVSQVDLCGPFQSYSYHNKRATVKIWYVVFCCATTTTISIKCMEDYSTSAFLQAFTRFSCEVGYPRRLLADEGSQLVKACETVHFDFQDIQCRLFKDSNVEFDTCPVGGHNMNGLVERKIREVKKSIEKSVSNQRLSIMQWETFASRAANSINDLPLGIRDYDGDLQSLDIITPNRLKLGRNNNRSPTGEFKLSDNSSKLIQQNQEIFDSWFELWLVSHVPGLIAKPKWFKSDINLKKGDVVLFTKQDSPIRSNYQFGMIESIEVGRDDKVRKVRVRYQNASENVHRFTNRSVRSIVVIHRVDETSVMMDLFNANKVATCGGAV